MAKKRSRAADYTVYVVVRLLVCVLQAFSLEAGLVAARFLAWLAFRIDRRHRLVALDNLRQAFPGRYSEDELAHLVRQVYCHFCSVIVEMVHIPRKLRPHNWRRYLRESEIVPLVEALLTGRPVLLVTGHYGNWELAGYMLGLLGFRTFAVARPLDNPYLDRFLRKFRERTGQCLLAKKGELDRIEGILQAGGIIAMLADQDAGRQGLFVDFFGRPASTHKAIALLALEHRATLVVSGARKVAEPFRYAIEVLEVIPPAEHSRLTHPLKELTQRFTSGIERLARLDPWQYLWLHRRWKHQPSARGRRAA